ncbi:MAG: heat-inducible transcriptional repressor HrcA [Alphaproteobacteria bacterium]|nr:heat-inducible transcriptional repressor HrcA [Alphaproteobacteria bacterium]
MIHELNERSREIFREIVNAYVETGEPIGSRTLARKLRWGLSAASIRNIMSDLETVGLLYAPHTSAGRLPTEAGLRLYVDGLLEVGNLTEAERASIEAHCTAANRSMEELLTEATSVLSGLSRCAAVVVAPRSDRPVRHIEFFDVGGGRVLVVLVSEGGVVENRIIQMPVAITESVANQAANYLNARLSGRTLREALSEINLELDNHRAELDTLTTRLVERGLAMWGGEDRRTLIVRGQSNLLEDIVAVDDLERVRALFEALETKGQVARLLDLAAVADDVRIFIGSEDKLFNLTGCSMIVAPYGGGREKVVGAIGVIGPSRLNYARIIPMVDYTAAVIGRLVG